MKNFILTRALLPGLIFLSLVFAACGASAADAPGETAGEGGASAANTPANLVLTTRQQEGPYYPITEPAERDNDLTRIGDGETAVGQIVLLEGRVLYQDGSPAAGAVVEIWQTDDAGIYMHPGDPQTADRDPAFQFYGEAAADGNGRYTFKTILPGEYEPRPRHIHFKVKVNGQETLTSQFYFADDDSLGSRPPDDILLTTSPGTDEAGNAVLKAEKDIVIAETG